MKVQIMVVLCFSLFLLASCTKAGFDLSNSTTINFKDVALEYTLALMSREYKKAYSMTSKEYKRQSSIETMKNLFEGIVPLDWGTMGPIEVGETMTNWPDKLPSDLVWVYVSIGGDVYSEAIISIVTIEEGKFKIRQVDYGRP